MPDREKVINGLRSIKTYLASQAIETTDSFAREGFIECQKDIDDALALLKDDELYIQHQRDGYAELEKEYQKLLKEQEAVKPMPKHKMSHNGITFTEMYGKCGRCGNWLIDGQNYCENCGAKIDWSEGR